MLMVRTAQLFVGAHYTILSCFVDVRNFPKYKYFNIFFFYQYEH